VVERGGCHDDDDDGDDDDGDGDDPSVYHLKDEIKN
jgi:hypothetical protein